MKSEANWTNCPDCGRLLCAEELSEGLALYWCPICDEELYRLAVEEIEEEKKED